MIFGTLINVATIVVGSIFGIVFRSKLPSNLVARVFQALGLFTFMLGVLIAIKVENIVVMIISLVLGTILGELINVEKQIEFVANRFKKLINHSHEQFSEGLVTAFLLFCTGSLTILGSIEEGVGNGITLLITKSILDGFAAFALASSFGIGVLFSIIPLFIYQSSLSILAYYLGNFFSANVALALSTTGGILLIGLGISMLDIKRIPVANMLPAIVLAPFFVWFLSIFK